MTRNKQRKSLAELIGKAERSIWGKSIDGIKGKRAAIADYLLDNGVIILPCNVGDTVYKIIPKCSPGFGMCPYSGGYGSSRCKESPRTCKAYIEEVEFNMSLYDYMDESVFLTKETAEKALERKNNKK